MAKRRKNGEPSRIVVFETHAEVELTKGLWAKIDVEDVPLVEGRPWRFAGHGGGYAAAGQHRNGTYTLMHWAISGVRGRNGAAQADHWNRDGLDNRRCNLRPCSHIENSCNRRSPRSTLASPRGVQLQPNGRYHARIRFSNSLFNLGAFATALEAAAAYNAKAIELHGEYAVLNDLKAIEEYHKNLSHDLTRRDEA